MLSLLRHSARRSASPLLLLSRPSSSTSSSSEASSSSAPPTTPAGGRDPSEFLDPVTSLPLPPALLPQLKAGPDKVWPERIGRDNKEPVDPDHPLWAFFRTDKTESGGVKTIELVEGSKGLPSGRPFTAAELRLKSFDELHTLWFLLLREKNIYYTQLAEAARRGVHANRIRQLGTQAQRAKIQTSMARIKYVLSERSHGFAAVAAQPAELAALRQQLLLSTGDAVSPTDDRPAPIDADVLAGRELPEPLAVRAFRAKLLRETGRDDRAVGRRRVLPHRGEGERRRQEGTERVLGKWKKAAEEA